jgi:hypothetical protein
VDLAASTELQKESALPACSARGASENPLEPDAGWDFGPEEPGGEWTEAEATSSSEECCLGSGHRLYVNAEYLLWWLKKDNAPPLVTTTNCLQPTLGALDTVVLFGGANLDHSVRQGGRWTAGYWLDDDQHLGVEGSFFGLLSHGVHFDAVSNGQVPLFRPFFRINTLPPANGKPAQPPCEDSQLVAFPNKVAGSVRVDTSSTLWGAEANLRHRLCCGSWYRIDLLGGFRYLSLEEKLGIEESLLTLKGVKSPLVPGETIQLNDSFQTANHFYGGQVGALTRLNWGGCVLDLKTKVALGATTEVVNVQGSTQFSGNSPQPGGLLAQATNIGRHSTSRFSVVPEVGVHLGYQVTDNLLVYAGYDFLYWSSVVRPGEQIDRVVNTTQLPSANHTNPVVGAPRPLLPFTANSFWVQGASVGLELQY